MNTTLQIVSPQDLANYSAPRDALQGVVDFINATLADPKQRRRYEQSFGMGLCFSLEHNAELTLEQAQQLLVVCKTSGWKNVQVLYSFGMVTINLSDQGNPYWPSNYRGQPFEALAPATPPELMAA